MTVLAKITLAAALLLSIAVPFGAFAAGEKTKGRYKTAIGVNVFLFMATIGVAAGLMFTGHAFAAEETAKAVNSAAGWGYLAAALSTGMSCLGGGIAVSAAASAALGAISEDSLQPLAPHEGDPAVVFAPQEGRPVVAHPRGELRVGGLYDRAVARCCRAGIFP